MALASREAFHEPRPHRDSRGDPLRVSAADLQPLQPLVDLVGTEPAGKRGQPEPPVGHIESEFRSKRSQSPQQVDSFLVGGEMRMDRPVGAELGQPENRVLELAFLEQRDQLVAQARRGEIADEAHLDAPAGEPQRVLVHAKAVAVLVPDRPEDPGRVVDERQVVQDADRLRLEVAPAAEGVDEPAEVGALERGRHRVDREVPAEEVLADRGVLDRRQRGRRVVELGARRDHVDALAVAVEHDRRAELLVRAHAAAERVGEGLRQRDRVALDRDVHVEAALAEQDVPDRAADEVDAVVRLAHRGHCLEHGRKTLELPELCGEADTGVLPRSGRLAEGAEDVAAGHDADDPVLSQDRNSSVTRGEQSLELAERRCLSQVAARELMIPLTGA